MAQTMHGLEFATPQGLKSHKPEFADELVRTNEKGPPSEPSTYHILPPKTSHVLMTNILMNNTIKAEINHEIL